MNNWKKHPKNSDSLRSNYSSSAPGKIIPGRPWHLNGSRYNYMLQFWYSPWCLVCFKAWAGLSEGLTLLLEYSTIKTGSRFGQNEVMFCRKILSFHKFEWVTLGEQTRAGWTLGSLLLADFSLISVFSRHLESLPVFMFAEQSLMWCTVSYTHLTLPTKLEV